jgi:uncharacterized protein with FMN-binding domain
MRRVILAIAGTAAGLVLLLSFKTHRTGVLAMPPAAITGTGAGGSASASSAGGAAAGSMGKGTARGKGAASGNGSSGSKGAAGTTTGGSVSKTVTGGVAQTIYGPVQVKIMVKNGKVTAADAVQYPDNTPRDMQLNAYAIPVLNQEAVAASSARIDAVSGATYTSEGYISSLQSAIDEAGL